MSKDFIDDLIQAVARVVTLDTAQLREVLILSGMPEKTANLRYLGFNRQTEEFAETSTDTADSRIRVFSAVAVINNRRVSRWRLSGNREKISRWVFNPRWARNPLDIFLNNLRCSSDMTDILSNASAPYTLFGIVYTENPQDRRFLRRNVLRIRPVVAIPAIDPAQLEIIKSFEAANEITKAKPKSGLDAP